MADVLCQEKIKLDPVMRCSGVANSVLLKTLLRSLTKIITKELVSWFLSTIVQLFFQPWTHLRGYISKLGRSLGLYISHCFLVENAVHMYIYGLMVIGFLLIGVDCYLVCFKLEKNDWQAERADWVVLSGLKPSGAGTQAGCSVY